MRRLTAKKHFQYAYYYLIRNALIVFLKCFLSGLCSLLLGCSLFWLHLWILRFFRFFKQLILVNVKEVIFWHTE